MVQARIQHKRDTYENWEASEMIPLAGEIIIYEGMVGTGNGVPPYDAMGTSAPKIKIGDGERLPKDLPFVSDPVTIGPTAPFIGLDYRPGLWIDTSEGGVLKYYDVDTWNWKSINTPSELVTYSVKINVGVHNPDQAVSYDHGYTIEPGSAAWDNMPIFRDIRPCVLLNGIVQYYLDKNDFSLKEDGSLANASDGDFMIEFPLTGFKIDKIYDNVADRNVITVKITNKKDEPGFSYEAFTDTDGNLKDKMYMGAFLGSVSNNRLQSVPGVNPTVSTTMDDFRQYAHNNGNGYRLMSFYPITLIQCLFLIKYCTLDSQSACGFGACNNDYIMRCGNTLNKPMFYGTADTEQVKVFGIEDLWGNRQAYLDGIRSYTEDPYCDLNFNYAVTVYNSHENNNGNGNYAHCYTNFYAYAEEAEWRGIGGCMSDPFANNVAGFLPYDMGDTSSTNHGYFCDCPSIFADRIAVFGGSNKAFYQAGIFTIGLCISEYDTDSFGDWNETYPYSNTTARLMYV